MKVKQNIISFILGMAIMIPFGGYAADLIVKAVDVPIYVDGDELTTPTYNINNKNYTSIRDVAEAMGGTVEWIDGQVLIETPKTDIEKVVESRKDSCVMVRVYKNGASVGSASGFVYNGYIITAKHVANEGDMYTIYTDDYLYGTNASLVDTETDLDISVLSADIKLPSVELGDSDRLKEGQKLIAITSPSGVKNAVDEGIYHGMTFADGVYHIGISDSNMDAGSSGGAVFNTKGELVGVVTKGVNGNGAAIPINDVKPFLEKLK